MKRWGWVALTAFTLACGPRKSSGATNTGYTGTWERAGDRAVSTLAIVADTGGYRFRWRKVAHDPQGRVALLVDCDWNGDCVETFYGEKTATFRHRTSVDPGTGHLVVEAVETREKPDAFTRRVLDEFVVDPDGLHMTAYTREQDAVTFPEVGGPMKHFVKVADGVAYPPGSTR